MAGAEGHRQRRHGEQLLWLCRCAQRLHCTDRGHGDNSFQGAAYLFANSNGTWSEGQKLTASDGLPGDEFGYRVVLTDNTLLVGAFTATVGGVVSQGAAYVFNQSD